MWTHTIRIDKDLQLSFLNYEILLSSQKLDYHQLADFLNGENKDENGLINYELKEFLNIIKTNADLHLEITKVIYLYNANFMRSTNNENIIFMSLVQATHKIFPKLDPIYIISSCFGAWFVYALSQPSGEELAHEEFVWKTRYSIIFEVKNLFKHFSIQLEFTTGVGLSLGRDTKTLVWVLLQTVVNHGTLRSKTKQTSKTKSEVLISGIKLNNFLLNQSSLQVLQQPPKILDIHNTYYLQSQHYSFLQIIIRPNKASWKKPQLTDLTFLQARLNMKLFINWEILDIVLLQLSKQFKLQFASLAHLEQRLNQIKLNWWDKKSQLLYHELFKIRYLLLVRQYRKDLEGGFYFRDYFDFRGRVYAAGPISYTFNKFTRCLYYYGVYSSNELDVLTKQLPSVKPGILNRILQNTNLQQKYFRLKLDCPLVQYYIFVIFFELGKLKKNHLISIKEGRLHEDDFIELGIGFYNRFETTQIEIDELLESIALINLLSSLNNDIYLKTPIYKDATASAIQLLTILLGPANAQVLKEVNLNHDDFWYDTYYWIIKRFWEVHTIEEELKPYFTRQALKKTIMTYNYQATYQTCLTEFKTTLQLSWDNEDPLNKKLLPIFKKFYNFLNELFESNTYFATSSDSIVNWCRSQWVENKYLNYKTLDDLAVPLAYYKPNKLRLERLILTKRETIRWAELSNSIDEQKMFRAIRANIIHSLDGYLVRSTTLCLGYPIITIHDSFGIDILQIPRLNQIAQTELTRLARLNLFGQKLLEIETYSVNSDYVLL